MKKIGVTADVYLFYYTGVEVTDEEYEEIKEKGRDIPDSLYDKINSACLKSLNNQISNIDNIDIQIWEMHNVDENNRWVGDEINCNFT